MQGFRYFRIFATYRFLEVRSTRFFSVYQKRTSVGFFGLNEQFYFSEYIKYNK